MHDLIYDFLKKLSKKIDRSLAFTTNNLIHNTNNLIELFFKVTFPGKIKRIFRTYDGAMNRIMLDNVRWMEQNVIDKYLKCKISEIFYTNCWFILEQRYLC